MNDAAVKAIWEYMTRLEASVRALEGKVEFLRGQLRARLKEEAEARERGVGWSGGGPPYKAPRLSPYYKRD